MTDPRALIVAYEAAFAAGSPSRLDRCYEPDGVLIPSPGKPLAGAAQRIAAHEHLLGFGLPMTVATRHGYVAGDVALLIVDWSMKGDEPAGAPGGFVRHGGGCGPPGCGRRLALRDRQPAAA